MHYDRLINAIKAYHMNSNGIAAICSLVMHAKPCRLHDNGIINSMEDFTNIYSDIECFLDEFAQRAIEEADKGNMSCAMSIFNVFMHEDLTEQEKEIVETQRKSLQSSINQSWQHREYEYGLIKHWKWRELIRRTAIDVQSFTQNALSCGRTIQSEIGAFTFVLQDIERAKLVSNIKSPTSIPQKRSIASGKKYEISQKTAAAYISVSERTWLFWKKGERTPPEGFSDELRRTAKGFYDWATWYNSDKEGGVKLTMASNIRGNSIDEDEYCPTGGGRRTSMRTH